jgi:syntaxin 16
MATRNRTLLFRKYRDALKSVRAPSASSPSSKSSAGGPVIELVSTSLLNQNRSYAPLSTEDPGNSRYTFIDLTHFYTFIDVIIVDQFSKCVDISI